MGKVLGIDFGLSSSRVAVINEKGKVKVVVNEQGERFIPSAIAVVSGQFAFGKVAQAQDLENYDVVTDLTNIMGLKKKIALAGETYTAVEIGKIYFEYLIKLASEYVEEKLRTAVITVPAIFDEDQIQDVIEAGLDAGLFEVKVIKEPLAAIIGYLGEEVKKINENFLVYHCGKEESDVALITARDGVLKIHETEEIEIGGDNFDDDIVDFIMEEFEEKHGIDLINDGTAIARIEDASEKIKKALDVKEEVLVNLPYIAMNSSGPIHLETTISKAKFSEVTSLSLEDTVDAIKNVVKESGHSMSQVDKLVLAGGLSKNKAIQDAIVEVVKKQPLSNVDPDDSIVIGAAKAYNLIEWSRIDYDVVKFK